MTKERDNSLDLIRTVALTNVIGVHYLLYTDFYNRPLETWGGGTCFL